MIKFHDFPAHKNPYEHWVWIYDSVPLKSVMSDGIQIVTLL